MTQKALAPIVFFAYNRPEQTLKTLRALAKNTLAKKSKLYVFIDGPKNDSDKEDIAKIVALFSQKWQFDTITIYQSDFNKGLYRSITEGVSKILEKYPKAIVVEDDIVTAPGFLSYMNDGLAYYENEPKIFSICGYTYPSHTFQLPNNYPHEVYFSERFEAWGWAIWKDRWESINFNRTKNRDIKLSLKEKLQFVKFGYDRLRMLEESKKGINQSWAIILNYYLFKKKRFAVSPVKSFSNNIGFIAKSTHCNEKGFPIFNHYEPLNQSLKISFTQDIAIHPLIQRNIRKKFTPYPVIFIIRRLLAKAIKPILKKIIHFRSV